MNAKEKIEFLISYFNKNRQCSTGISNVVFCDKQLIFLLMQYLTLNLAFSANVEDGQANHNTLIEHYGRVN